MCGLAGFLSTRALSADEVGGDLPRMSTSLQHRGPDDEGFWHDAQAGIALSHRRLSIIDLSALGHQPMRSAGQRYVIVYNGEIYNYRELRAELVARGYGFRGGSDTEVLLAAIESWGVEGALERAMGMFAFALWDSKDRVLHLARDRFGEKPLYYGVCGDTLLFGSELKALRQHRAWPDEIDRDSLALLMQHDFIPAPYSIFKNIRKVQPGRIVTAKVSGGRFTLDERRYWRPEVLFEQGALESPQLTAEQSLELIDQALSNAIERQMLADVPVGAFLSGGTDSSLIVSYMRRATSQRVKTFSIGFTEAEYNEAPFARAVAEHLGTEHTEYTVTPRDCLNMIPKLPQIYDEPFADQAQIPTYLLCQLARGSVTVALSGDGGDELFGGYRRYAIAMSKWQTMKRLPAAVRAGGSALVERLPLGALQLAARPAALLWPRAGQEGIAERLHHHSSRWKAATLRDFYRTGLRRWHSPRQPVLGARDLPDRNDALRPRYVDDLKQMMHFDTCEYLPEDVLVKVDRAAMAVSLETRVPMLDVEVARAAWRIPSSVLLKDGRGKWVLRELLQRHIPQSLVDRPKKGFAVPIAQWLRGELRPWAHELIDTYRLRQEGYLDAPMIQRRWRQHLSGQTNWTSQLWNALTFQAWLEDWRRSRSASELRAQAG
jgi:asparagine synthase (glutamine-hydrolysing)